MPKENSSLLDELDEAINQPPRPSPSRNQNLIGYQEGDVITQYVEHFPIYCPRFTKTQLAELYNRLMIEIVRNDYEKEILGEEAAGDLANVSLDSQLKSLLKLTTLMRLNLHAQMSSAGGASNKEIQNTLKSCIDTIKALTSHQESIMKLERQRIIEQCIVEVLGTLDPEACKDFQETLRRRLEELSQT